MNKTSQRMWRVFSYVAGLHVAGLVWLSLMRLALFVAGRHFLSAGTQGHIGLVAEAFVRGVWFDNVIACYVSALPVAATLLCVAAGYTGRWLTRPVLRWMQVLTCITAMVAAANIPYFLYFFKDINSSIWNWAEYGTTTLGLMLGEPAYYPPALLFVATAGGYVWLTNRWHRHHLRQMPAPQEVRWPARVGGMLCGAAMLGLCLFGIRGRVGYNPIKVSAAYFCEDAFLNQLGISPAFNLLTSTLDDRRPENKALHLMPTPEATHDVQQFLHRSGTPEEPLAYDYVPDTLRKERLNVVIILMESMSANLTSIAAPKGESLTPFLDSLMSVSTTFTHCYSAGCHTNHGIFSTLYSYPALMFRNLMKGTVTPHYEGLPQVMQKAGYRTMFFMTHESQYDNMNAFLRSNGYDEIYSQENYPRSERVNSFGVPDHYLYRYALNTLAERRQPFFATLLSISNHPPYIVPDWFKPQHEDKEKAIVEYADDALREFFAEARRQPWYGNTVFVLLGDHGKLVGEAENEMPESLNHIPLIIHRPGQQAATFDGWTMQLDVQPILLGLLGMKARQNNFGIDLLSKKAPAERPCAFYTADNVIGARTNDHLYIYNPTTQQELLYRDGRATNRTDDTFRQLRQHLFAMLQTAQNVLETKR